jgi:hypothetical protein
MDIETPNLDNKNLSVTHLVVAAQRRPVQAHWANLKDNYTYVTCICKNIRYGLEVLKCLLFLKQSSATELAKSDIS